MKPSLTADDDSTGNSRFEIGRHILIVIQLLLLSFISFQYELEPTLFITRLLALTTVLYMFHPYVPPQYTTRYFLLSGVVALGFIIGPINGAIVLGYSFLVILIARNISPPFIRNLGLLGLGALPILLLYLQNEWLIQHKAAYVTFGSFFMFRLLIFLRDKQHQKMPPSLEMDLAYFFMLPNTAITLFPAVDYQAFTTSKINSHDFAVYKKGLHWITIGVFFLVAYRIINSFLFIPAQDISDILTFSRHGLASYLLIVRLSGIFHIAIGSLCLFGFNLPPVFNNYLLASSFTDLWQRVNIYFRDFLLKVFYYPVLNRIRNTGHGLATPTAILGLFAISWLLHAYQWLWLQGEFPVRWVDLVFWGALGLLTSGNVLLERRQQRTESKPASLWKKAGKTTAQMIAMIACMSILSTIWFANSIHDWLASIQVALHSPPQQFAILLSVLIFIWLVGSILHGYLIKYQFHNRIQLKPESTAASLLGFAMISGLLLIQLPWLQTLATTYTPYSLEWIGKETVQSSMSVGYFNKILTNEDDTNLLETMNQGRKQRFADSESARIVNDFREVIQIPNTSTLFKGQRYTINEWGMRDQAYQLEKPLNTIRTIMMGGSFVVGSGVSDTEVFDMVLEHELNAEHNAVHHEVLNFGCSGYDLIDCLVRFDQDSLAKFNPDYLFIISHGVDVQKNTKDVKTAISKKIPLPYPFLEKIVTECGLTVSMSDAEMTRALEPYGKLILEHAYQMLYDRCKDNGIQPVWVYWPTIELRPGMHLELDTIKPIIEQIGYQVIDMSDVYNSYEPKDLYLSGRDRHPNAKGHALVAEWLFPYFMDMQPSTLYHSKE